MHRRTCPATLPIFGSVFVLPLALAHLALPPACLADVQPHPGLLRYPDVSKTHVAFVYANDIWIVPREGGMATPLASPPGEENFPRFSPDGKTIAFVGNYDGDRDIFTLSVDGGIPQRVTHHPATEMLYDWTPDGRLAFYTRGMGTYPRAVELFTVAASGGLPEKMPVPYGANGAVSPDGQWLAYTPHTRDARTWKRYRGGMATDIWLFNLKSHESKRITNWEGTDSLPMWHKQTVYYLSDNGPEHRLNIWSYDTQSGQRRQITSFKDFDTKWPAMGPGPDGNGEIVLQNGPGLYLLNLATRQASPVQISVPGDRPTLRAKSVNCRPNLQSMDISSTGKRGVFEARGEIFSVPAKHGTPQNLTRTSGAAERTPSWSPDGKWIAYFSDATGEYQLYIVQSDGLGETRQLTKDGKTYPYSPTWSPDSKWIAFCDKTGAMFLLNVESGESQEFDKEPWGGRTPLAWAPDSNWIVYSKGSDNTQAAIWVYNVGDGARHQLTSGMFNDTWPTFDRKGDYIYFASNRRFESPKYEDVGSSFIYDDTDLLFVVPLRKDMESPFKPKIDVEEWDKKKDGDKDKDEDEDENKDKDDNGKDDSEKKDSAKDNSGGDKSDDTAQSQPTTQESDESQDDKEKDDKKEEIKPVKIDLDDFEARAVQLPVRHGAFSNLALNGDGKLLYVRGPVAGTEGNRAIKIFDIDDEKKEEKNVIDDVGGFAMSADGKKLLVGKNNQFAIIDAKPDQKMEDRMPAGDLWATIDPRAEWRQIFDEAWRIQRDFFYDPNMHGVNWNAMREHYGAMIDDCVNREDVGFVISEMIAEINVGHAYYGGGDLEDQPSRNCGLLGCDFELGDGAYRISKIYTGGPWDYDARGPLSQPGVDVKVGDYLLAVNGTPVDAARDPWAAFIGLAGDTVMITVSEKPTLDDAARRVPVTLLRSDNDLRYRAWVEQNRKYVDEKSDGKVGYIYVPNTGRDGQNELFRQFYGQRDKAALIIDERWNGGGQIPTRFIELLNRPVTNYWAVRDGKDWTWPQDSHQGPKCMLINGLAGSGGDMFPWLFKQAGLGKLIGTRTWGGLVGISGNPQLVDGAFISAPTFAFYEKDGTWGIEGHGVDPDLEVIDDPGKMMDGADPQIDRAIALMLDEIQRHPYVKPARPAYPDRSGMGIRDEDR